jgi:predicted amidophosphoribosyltransferase
MTGTLIEGRRPTLIDTGRLDELLRTIYACPYCRKDLEDLTGICWCELPVYRCHYCGRMYEVV